MHYINDWYEVLNIDIDEIHCYNSMTARDNNQKSFPTAAMLSIHIHYAPSSLPHEYLFFNFWSENLFLKFAYRCLMQNLRSAVHNRS